MFRFCFALMVLGLSANAATVTQFVDAESWQSAAQIASGPSYKLLTEDFAGNQITSPITLTGCEWSCADSPQWFGGLTGDQLIGAVGKHAQLPGDSSWHYYVSDQINFGATLYGVGLDLNVSNSTYGGFGLRIDYADGSSTYLYPFGHTTDSYTGNWTTPAYSGFLGWVSDSPIADINFNSGDVQFAISRIQMADPAAVPEPQTALLTACAGLLLTVCSLVLKWVRR